MIAVERAQLTVQLVTVLRHARHGSGAPMNLGAVLFASDTSLLLREAKSLELLARLVDAGGRRVSMHGPRARFDQARAILLHDLAQSPKHRGAGAPDKHDPFHLKQGFKQRFGLPVYALYQQQCCGWHGI